MIINCNRDEFCQGSGSSQPGQPESTQPCRALGQPRPQVRPERATTPASLSTGPQGPTDRVAGARGNKPDLSTHPFVVNTIGV